MSTSRSMLQSAPTFEAKQLRAALEARGYRCTTALLPGVRSLPAGCMMSLQFGDRIAMNADGVTCVTLRCSIQINGAHEHVSGATCWQIQKLVSAPAGQDRLCYAIETDLILGGGIELADVLTQGANIYQHLLVLFGDASATLRGLSLARGRANAIAPVMRIEARVFGDLAVGRSGLVGASGAGDFAHSAKVAIRHLQITQAACDWLRNEVLPDLGGAIGNLDPQAQTPTGDRPCANDFSDACSPDPCLPDGWPHKPSIQDTASRNAALQTNPATLVPERIQ